MNSNNHLHPAVILDITQAGYDIIRSLYKYKIPLYAFSYKANSIENKTKRVTEIIDYNAQEDLLEKLIALAKRLKVKPVLYLSSDHRLEFVMEHYDVIQEHFLINLPSIDTLNTLLDKRELNDFALKNNLQAPATVNITPVDAIEKVKSLDFPIIVKPFVKTAAWYDSERPKAIIYNTFEEYEADIPDVLNIEDRLIVQEFIPGGADDIYACFVYFNQKGEFVQSFTGQKIRQWRSLTGTSSCIRPFNHPELLEQTIQFFKLVNYKGFGSMEYKQNPNNGKFYLIEPTVGRFDLNTLVCTVGGANLPLAYYNDVTNQNIVPKEKPNDNFAYVHELYDMRSAYHSISTKHETPRQLLKSYKGKLYFHYMNTDDPVVTRKVLYKVSRYIASKLFRYMTGKTSKA
ncbi:hypothetical protein KEM09_08830 [Carboxylicivirga mesophila]|uniref:ATP-grasp domain-containing protein n=1 Tax=Carboxylicivirga mesophila TaxID=1166478 RepID=A0ABS5KAY1_9BACT|nr:hypothetical protein [Carboxylicivirga mesophila]MBS2211503.1 hypothetical protein [Carboxylicivirga mesophila]